MFGFCTDMRQAGVIVWSSNMNRQAWITQARAEGYRVLQEEDKATLWLPLKKGA
jgi:hypothetical protein